MRYDRVVVGGGVSGLTSALILARRGMRVALAEKAPKLGPVLRGFTLGGVRYDTGFHYAGDFGENGPLDRFFKFLDLYEGVEKRPMGEPFDRVFFDDGSGFGFVAGWANLRESLVSMFPAEREGIDQYLTDLREAYGVFPYINPAAKPADFNPLDRANSTTLANHVDRLVGEPRLKSLLYTHCMLHGGAPDEVSFAAHASVVSGYYGCAHTVAGGGGAIVDSFERELARAGVDLYLGRPASRVEVNDRAVTGVRLASGETLETKGCVVSADPRTLYGLLGEAHFRPAYRKRLGALTDTPSAFFLFVRSKTIPEELADGNLFLLGPGDEMSFGRDVPMEDRPVYVTPASPAGEGEMAGWMAICPGWIEEVAPAGERDEGYGRAKAIALERLRRICERRYPAIMEGACILGGATPLTMKRWASSPAGGLYGVVHRANAVDLMAGTKVKGLTLAGQAIAAPGLLGGMLSGFLACGSIMGHETVMKDLEMV